jgi:hypothetical protein
MWWSAFSYDKKGLYYIWPKESDAVRKERERQQTIVLTNWNNARYYEDKALWELTKPMERMQLRSNKPGPKPKFRHAENGAYVLKDGKGGINWFRHQAEVLKPHLFPFAKKCKEALPNPRKDTVVMEDGAAAHALAYSDELYIAWDVVRMLWPANSPDLNMIEPCWFYMKVETTKKGAITLDVELRAAWVKC